MSGEQGVWGGTTDNVDNRRRRHAALEARGACTRCPPHKRENAPRRSPDKPTKPKTNK